MHGHGGREVAAAQPPRSVISPALRDYFGRTQAADIARWLRAHPDVGGWLAWTAVASAVYLVTAGSDRQPFDYFVRLADAFLHGRIYLTEAPSWLNELIPAGDGRWFVAYPPMPAIVLMPFVAIFGTEFPQQVLSSVLGGLSVGLAWLVLGRFALTLRARLVLTATFGFGTVFWYVAETGNTWYLAHVVAVFFSLAAVLLVLDRRWPFLAGLCLGCAGFSRLPVALAAPAFLALAVGFGRPSSRIDRATIRTAILFGLGVAIPLGLYALYNLVRWGTLLDNGYVLIPGVLQDPIYEKHGILSVWYIPRNLFAIFLRSWNYVDDPPFLQPSWWGLSLFLTTPLYLWLFRARLRDPRVLIALAGILLTAIPIVTHGNVGISQFGYRFSLDFQVLLFVILATVFERGMSRLAVAAAAASVVVCAYAIWAISLDFVAY
jgi:hypothetical protein